MWAKRLSVVLTLVAILCAGALCAGAYLLASWKVHALDIPTFITVRICGNGVVENGELCDDGTAFNDFGYGSTTAERHCAADCNSFGPYCGDGVLQVRFTEECDDGNNTSGDLCDALCKEEPPVIPRATGAPPRGPIEPLPAIPGTISAETLTKVILRGKAYPNSVVNILLDGKLFGTVQADTNADFLFTTTNVTPGTATFSFNAKDRSGATSITVTDVFEVVQSAVTTVANIFLPPTITAKPEQVEAGEHVVLSGQAPPSARIFAQIHAPTTTLESASNTAGDWALSLDTASFKNGNHTAKAYFQLATSSKSGFGKSISFYIGTQPAGGCGAPDMNGDGKVNLVDFSIFLLHWNTTDPEADYNCDQRVNLADFSIMLFAWTG
jgi:cysteine-rich repeat protein